MNGAKGCCGIADSRRQTPGCGRSAVSTTERRVFAGIVLNVSETGENIFR